VLEGLDERWWPVRHQWGIIRCDHENFHGRQEQERTGRYIAFGVAGQFHGYKPNYFTLPIQTNLFTWAVLHAHSRNRAGVVEIRGTDPRRRPDINFKYYYDGDQSVADKDLQAIVDGVTYVRKLMDDAKGETINESWPGRDKYPNGSPALKELLKYQTWGHHACCTAPIGKVIDGDFRVLGISNLRVVDASVFPDIPGKFIMLPIYMISEKAALVIATQAKTLKPCAA